MAERDPGGTLVPPRNDRLIGLFLAGVVAFNPPLLHVFGLPVLLFGWPLIYFYLFSMWAALIALLAWHIEAANDRMANDTPPGE